ncbi:MAG: hypothetical protein AB7U83_19660 [Vicinamibacterales bacterium]
MSGRAPLAALAVAIGLAVLHTWPLAADVTGQSRLDNADTALNTWAVTWVADTLPRAPLHVFDAPIFHPERRTLAYSEHLLLQGALAVPLRAAGVAPVAIYNLLVLAGFALSAWAMWQLVAHWTGDQWAGLVAGAAFAFNAHLLTRFAHLQALHGEFVPVVLLGVDRLVAAPRRRHALLLAGGLVLVGLTSIYLLVFAATAAVVGLAARVTEWRTEPRRVAGLTALALAITALALTPVLWPYYAVHTELGLERSVADAAQFSATWRDYLSTGGRLHLAGWSWRVFTGHDALFPGLTVVVLAVASLVSRGVHPGRRRMLAAIAVAGVVLSVGPALPAYGWLHEHLAPLRVIRVASRWGILWLTALAALAGLGTAALATRWPARRVLIGTTALALVTLEAVRAPMAFTPPPPVPPVYRELATLHDAVLLEFPLFPPPQFNLNAPYLVAQTVHGQRIVAGYSGFAPPAFAARTAALGTFPGESARAMIGELGVTHVVLHLAPLVAGFGAAAVDAVDAVPWLERIYGDDEARVFRVRETPGR